jgi:predicted RNA methylase
MHHARVIRDALRQRHAISDQELDLIFPDELRERSPLHWTPVDIAMRAAELLAPEPGVRVLDVGAGAGKLCLVGALVSEAMWWGIEQDATLVAAANRAAWLLGVDHRTRFVHGDGSRLAWDEFDALYFYNPFGMLTLGPHASAFLRYATLYGTLRRVEQQLASTRIGTRVVTYHGFGGTLPPGFTRLSCEPAGDDVLELWVRDRAAI